MTTSVVAQLAALLDPDIDRSHYLLRDSQTMPRGEYVHSCRISAEQRDIT